MLQEIHLKYRSLKLFLVTGFFFLNFYSFSQLNIANVRNYNQTIDILNSTDSSVNYNQLQTSIRPILETKVNTTALFKDEGEYYYWITQKLFKEHFLIFKGDDYSCTVDPILDLNLGYENNSQQIENGLKTWNTRGVNIKAKFFNKFAFETAIYETQASLLNYQAQYVDAHGEFYPNGNSYKQQNAIIPSYARTKPFKETGYDFAFATGYFSYTPTTWLNIQAGNGNQFIGNGYRSLLLSNFTVNYPYIKPEFSLFKGRLQYTLIYASLQNLYRLPYSNSPEANYEKKMSTTHFVNFALNKNIQIGFFEGNIWNRTDSLGTKKLKAASFNPILGVNSLLVEDNNYNSIGGININARYKKSMIYGQLLLDHSSIAGTQIGLKFYHVMTQNLHLQFEFNQTKENAYTANNKRLNYSHSNLPLAHPYESGFKELIGILDYNWKRIYLQAKFIYAEKASISNTESLPTILLANNQIQDIDQENTWHQQLEVGYRFNKKYNLELFFGNLLRISTDKQGEKTTNFTYFGVRTNLNPKQFDW
ncbi:hypothetical protein DNU06_09645 [Putridiphycobacter roseus]|uniref:Gliding motility protein RemB n=1 Tax=Putridiphycobacter roseus TaxID=2219161 RepID=A0A2W1ND26_9FLAO|nr:hypothetical protein [Putridiphycobacter roseus]PZE17003.1 hypothetical protein DNU06_09645 [Putridiphycobacter roseus]